MTEDPAPTSRQRHIVRLAVFAVFLLVLFYLLAADLFVGFRLSLVPRVISASA